MRTSGMILVFCLIELEKMNLPTMPPNRRRMIGSTCAVNKVCEGDNQRYRYRYHNGIMVHCRLSKCLITRDDLEKSRKRHIL